MLKPWTIIQVFENSIKLKQCLTFTLFFQKHFTQFENIMIKPWTMLKPWYEIITLGVAQGFEPSLKMEHLEIIQMYNFFSR